MGGGWSVIGARSVSCGAGARLADVAAVGSVSGFGTGDGRGIAGRGTAIMAGRADDSEAGCCRRCNGVEAMARRIAAGATGCAEVVATGWGAGSADISVTSLENVESGTGDAGAPAGSSVGSKSGASGRLASNVRKLAGGRITPPEGHAPSQSARLLNQRVSWMERCQNFDTREGPSKFRRITRRGSLNISAMESVFRGIYGGNFERPAACIRAIGLWTPFQHRQRAGCGHAWNRLKCWRIISPT
jgi:hypothetical protein